MNRIGMRCAFLALSAFASASVWATDVIDWPMTPENVKKLTVRAYPSEMKDLVAVTNIDDTLVIDAARAFAKGLVRVEIDLPDIPALRDWSGEAVGFVARVGASRNAGCTLLMRGEATVGGKTKAFSFRRGGWRNSVVENFNDFALVGEFPDAVNRACVRFNIDRQTSKPFRIRSFRVGRAFKMGIEWSLPKHTPELIFHASFDDTDAADVAGGAKRPLVSEGLAFASGRKGRAVRLTKAAKSRLAYSLPGNLLPERGTASLWIKREGDCASMTPRTLYALPKVAGDALGSGAMTCYLAGPRLYLPQFDDAGFLRAHEIAADDAWHHVAVTWDEDGSYRFYIDGKGVSYLKADENPFLQILTPLTRRLYSRRPSFDRFFVGNRDGADAFDGLIDEFRVWSAPLTEEDVLRVYLNDGGEDAMKTDYTATFTRLDRPNPYLTSATCGLGLPERDVVAEVRLDRVTPCARFRSVGDVTVKKLDGVRYLEVEPGWERRFAVGFDLDPTHLLWCVEIDYPDNAERTMCCVVQDARSPAQDYSASVGVMCGGEYAPTMKIQTHRLYFWSKGCREAAVVLRSARPDQPAAASAIRVCKVRGSRLPDAAVADAKPVDGWGRTVAFLFEDPSIAYDFALPDFGVTAAGLETLTERTAAVMKFTGMNLLCYPGSFYGGRIGAGYETRHHAPNFLGGFYARFDHEGLGLVPMVNQYQAPVAKEVPLSFASIRDGSLHPTPYDITRTGMPSSKGSHGSPPIFNIAHKAVQDYIASEIDAYLDQGGTHPSFKGIGFNFSRHTIAWFGALDAGYNDYNIEAFERMSGIRVPVDRADPLRGAKYHAFLTGDRDILEKWLDCRCAVVTGFWISQAKRIRARRPDLKLLINIFQIPNSLPGYGDPDHFRMLYRGGGLDPEMIRRVCDNVVICNTQIPSDYRHGNWGAGKVSGKPELDIRQYEIPGFFDVLKNAAYPVVHQHERYFESAVGTAATPNTPRALSCDWMTEIPWRVTTINPGGFYALRHFVEPLRHQDLLGVSKGGFLMGCYGMEPYLARFAKAFRALPAVLFDDRRSPNPNVTVRGKRVAGMDYLYAVNTSDRPQSVKLNLPSGFRDLVSGRGIPTTGGVAVLSLEPYELRSFSK